MRKLKVILALVVTLVMMFSLVACGSTEENKPATDTTKEHEEVIQTPTETDEQIKEDGKTEEVDPPVTEDVQKPENTEKPDATEGSGNSEQEDDTNGANGDVDEVWGDNKFEEMMPEPPVKGWFAKQTDDFTYEMTLENPSDADVTAMCDFAKSLENEGYSVREESETSYTAKAANGNFIKIRCEDGRILIVIFNLTN